MYLSRAERKVVAVLIGLTAMLAAGEAASRVLTVEQIRLQARQYNRTYLRAAEEVKKARGDVTRARAGALPEVELIANYNRNFYIPSFFIVGRDPTNPQAPAQTFELQTGFKNSFGATLSLRQSLWKGGKVFTALKIAREYKTYSEEVARQVRMEVDYNAEALFYNALLQEARLRVVRKAIEADSLSLDFVQKQYNQGLVSEFELLRAKVELSNLQPQLLQAESDLRLSHKRLKSFIGLDLQEPITLAEDTGDTSVNWLPDLEECIDSALSRRPDIRQAKYLETITQMAIRVARADYFPSLEAVSRYDWQGQSDRFTLQENISRSWSAGVTLTIPLFKGGETHGAVTQAVADHREAELSFLQKQDDVRLEVEEAYDHLVQARKTLDIQGTTIAQAEEGLRIANLRYGSGVGTLLEVLSAEAALTNARRVASEALYTFRTARAGLKHATAVDFERINN